MSQQTAKTAPPSSSAPSESSNRVKLGLSNRLLARPEIGALVAAIVIFIFFIIVAPAFRSADSFFTVLYQASTIGSWPSAPIARGAMTGISSAA